MKTLTNVQLITRTGFDSGSLGGLAAVVHRFAEPGDHQLTILQADQPVHTLSLRVLPVGQMPAQLGQQLPSGTRPTAVEIPLEVHLDLGQVVAPLGQLAAQPPGPALQVGAEGYAVFHAPTGAQGFAVQVQPSGAPDITFDTRRLQNGDIFSVTLLRPGRYSLANASTGASGEIRVAYPVVSDTPYRPPDPLEVQCGDSGFQPSAIELKPAQGLIFHIGNTEARIQIELVEPDDGPAATEQRAKRPLNARWEKPMPPDQGS
jgi:hypothetical protein